MKYSVVGEGHGLSLVVIPRSSVATTFALMKGNDTQDVLPLLLSLKF
jgi:hypothetical protein